jgi:hypothetical protein
MKNIMIMRNSLALSLILTFISTLVLSSKQSFSQTPVDFSGTWILNVAKSTTLPKVISSKIIITQIQNEITLNIAFVPKDTMTIKRTDKYFIGSAISTKSTNQTRTLKSDWSPDKQSFSTTEIIVTNENGTQKESMRITTYSITDMGKTLIIKIDDTLPDGSIIPENDRHSINVYSKS